MKKFILIICAFFLTSCLAKQVESIQTETQDVSTIMDLVFIRDYSQAHLNANPRQIIKKIIVRLESESINKALESEPDAYGWVYAKPRDSANWYMQILRCMKLSKPGSFHCYADSDGGGFDLRIGSEQLLLEDKDNVRMEKCGIVWEESNDKDSTGSLSKNDSEAFILDQNSKSAFNKMLQNSKCDTVESIKNSKL